MVAGDKTLWVSGDDLKASLVVGEDVKYIVVDEVGEIDYRFYQFVEKNSSPARCIVLCVQGLSRGAELHAALGNSILLDLPLKGTKVISLQNKSKPRY